MDCRHAGGGSPTRAPLAEVRPARWVGGGTGEEVNQHWRGRCQQPFPP